MTREEILAEYKVDQYGVIRSPGKFEGEMLYIPYFWEAWLNGACDETEDGPGGEISLFWVTDNDRREFPELCGVARVDIWETSDGFVLSSEVT